MLFEHLGATRALFELYARRRQPAHDGPSSGAPAAAAARAAVAMATAPLQPPPSRAGRLLPLPQRAASGLLPPLLSKPSSTLYRTHVQPPPPKHRKRRGSPQLPQPLPPPGVGNRAADEPVLELSGWLMLWKDAGLLGPAPTQLSDLELQQVLVASQQSLVVGTNLGLPDGSLNYTDFIEALLRVAW